MKNVSFKIDGRKCTAEKGLNLIEAAKQNGIFIPTLCHFKHLNPIGSCRVCTVKNHGKTILQNRFFDISLCTRSYSCVYVRSRLITKTKHMQARLVMRWETTREVLVTGAIY